VGSIAAFLWVERIKPGHPQQNGRHERMHLTLKKETTRPPACIWHTPTKLAEVREAQREIAEKKWPHILELGEPDAK